MFQARTFNQIVAGMIRHMKATQDRITDFHVGGVARTLIEAPAVELDAYYQRVLYGLLEAIPVAVYHAFDFDALPDARAGGTVRITADALQADALAIPAGTIILRPGTNIRYATVAEATIPAGSNTVDIRVAAEFAGVDGNAPANTLTAFGASAGTGLTVVNPLPIVGGREAESDAERKNRFVRYVGSLSRGTPWSINYAATSTAILGADGRPSEYVARVGVDEGAGRVTLYILGSGGAPSSELVAAVQSAVDGRSPTSSNRVWVPGYRPAGVEVVVAPMAIRLLDVGMRVSFFSADYAINQDFVSAARTALDKALFDTYPGDLVQANELIDVVLGLPGVQRVIYDTNTNTRCELYQAIRLGSLTLSALVN